jgi:O-antigen/teichoic acid export membrane protein
MKIKGDAAIIFTTVTFVVYFCNIIGGQAMVYLIPRLRLEKLILPAYLWTLIVTLSAYLIFSFFHVFTPFRAFNICLLSLFVSLINIHATILLAKQKIKEYNTLYALPIFLSLLGMLVAIYGYDLRTVRAYIYPLYFGYIVTLILSFFYCFKYLIELSLSGVFEEIESSFKFGGSYQLVDLFQLLNLRFYFYLLYYLQGTVDLGFYSLGVSLLEVVWIFARSVSVVSYSHHSSENNNEVLVKETLRYLKMSLILSLVGLLFVMAVPVEGYRILFGESFMYIKYSVKWLYPGVLVYNVMLVVQSYYFSKGKYSKLIFANIAGFLAGLMVCNLLIPSYYFSGASAGASISFILSSIIILMFFIRDNRLSIADFIISKQDFLFINNVFKSYFKRG